MLFRDLRLINRRSRCFNSWAYARQFFTTKIPARRKYIFLTGRCPEGGVMKRRYDTTFIIDGNLPDTERQALIERFAATLRRSGGDVEQIIRWGLRTLAYTINKRSHGYYVIFYYLAEPSVIAAFERELRLNEFILRYMTLVYEGKHPEYIRDEGASDTETSKVSAVSGEESADEDEDEDAIDSIDDDEMESDLGIDEDDADDEADSTDKEKE